MSATICDCTRQTATRSGSIVTRPAGPGGRASAPEIVQALRAAARAICRARSSGDTLSGSEVVGTSERKPRIASATRPAAGLALVTRAPLEPLTLARDRHAGVVNMNQPPRAVDLA